MLTFCPGALSKCVMGIIPNEISLLSFLRFFFRPKLQVSFSVWRQRSQEQKQLHKAFSPYMMSNQVSLQNPQCQIKLPAYQQTAPMPCCQVLQLPMALSMCWRLRQPLITSLASGANLSSEESAFIMSLVQISLL